MEATDSGIWIRFVGKQLVREAVPVQDLSFAMLAVQRLIYKVHLFQNERLSRFSVPSDRERNELALHLDERRRESDAYLLLADPIFEHIVAPLVVLGISTLAAYAVAAGKWWREKNRESEKPEAPKEISESRLAVYVFPQVESLVRRVDSSTGIEQLEIYSDSAARVAFGAETRFFIKSIGSEPVPGAREILEGRVKTLYYDDNCALVERQGGPNVKVFLGVRELEEVRKTPERWQKFSFYGRPRWRLGAESLDYREFDAEAVRAA